MSADQSAELDEEAVAEMICDESAELLQGYPDTHSLSAKVRHGSQYHADH